MPSRAAAGQRSPFVASSVLKNADTLRIPAKAGIHSPYLLGLARLLASQSHRSRVLQHPAS